MKDENFEEQFMRLYETGISTTEICKQLGVNRDKGYKLLKKMGLKSNPQKSKKCPKEKLEKIKSLYLSGKTITELQTMFPEYRGGINGYLRREGVTRHRGTQSNCNEQYFDTIDDPQKAYFLGLLLADGCVTQKKKNNNAKTIRIELQIQDKYIIEEFAKVIESKILVKESYGTKRPYVVNNKIYYNEKHEAYLSIGSSYMANTLATYGCVPRKSKTLDKLPDIPQEYYKDLILGYYDGDGIASVGQKHYMGFIGTKNFLKEIAQQINKDTGLPEPNINYNRFNDMYYLQYTKTSYQIVLWNYFYSHTNYITLLRKKEKMRKALGL